MIIARTSWKFSLHQLGISKMYDEQKRTKIPESGLPTTTISMNGRIKRTSQRDPWLSNPRVIAQSPVLTISATTVQQILVEKKCIFFL